MKIHDYFHRSILKGNGSMKYTVLFNPNAGNGTGAAEAEKLRDILKGDELTFTDITSLNGYAEFLAGLSDDERLVLAGGDGTLNRFINETDGLDVGRDVYYFAAGSGNDFAHDLGKAKDDAPFVITEYLKDLPTVTVNGKAYKFLNGVGYGIDGYCCEVGDKQRETSDKPVNYTAIAIKGLLFYFKPCNAKITVDGVEHTYNKVWLAPTMNGRFYGGGMMPTPDQDRLGKDKTVSCMVFYGSGKLKTLAVFPSIFKGEHVKHKEMIEILTGHDIKVEFDQPTALQIDGETILGVTEYEAVSAKVPAKV